MRHKDARTRGAGGRRGGGEGKKGKSRDKREGEGTTRMQISAETGGRGIVLLTI